MAKRRSKKKPNIPQATLDRARRQAGLEPEEEVVEESPTAEAEPASETEEDDSPAEEPKVAATKTTSERSSSSSSSSRRRKVSQVQLERSRAKGELTREMVEEILHNPTETVSAEQLAQEYGHVLRDLRNMGILAVALMGLLVGLAQFI